MNLDTLGFDLDMQRTLSLGRLEKMVDETRPDGIPDSDVKILKLGVSLGHKMGFADGAAAAALIVSRQIEKLQAERAEEKQP